MIPQLSDDVIIEILARLPVRSLLKFRCVCKSWLSLISSSHFVKTHIKKSKKDADFTHHGIMLNFFRGNLKKLSVPSLLNESEIDISDTGYSLNLPRFSDPFVGSCDGLICLALDNKNVILWNPATRNRKNLPEFGVGASGPSRLAYGFGYDESSDDYKVVGFCTSDAILPEVIVKVYSLKNDIWKRIKNFKHGGLIDNKSTFANGKLHWRSYTESELESERGLKLVSLDLQTEEYRIRKMPDFLKGDFYSRMGESEGRLFLLRNHMTKGEVWIMDDDYGLGKETWTKVVTFPHIDDFLEHNDVHVLYVLKNDQVVFFCGSTFVVFDAKDCNFAGHVVKNQGGFTGAVTYFESLVSPLG